METQMPEPLETLDLLSQAVIALLKDEGLVYANPGEQALTAELSNLMRPYFGAWSVSAEWDRKQQEQKMLSYGWLNEVAKLRAIRPDIIVHRIGAPENILVVEAKRIENRNDAQDKAKLAAMTGPDGGYSYEVGVRLVFDLPNSCIPDCEVFIAGQSNAELTQLLRNSLPRKEKAA